MPKPPLIERDAQLESDIIATLIAGHKQWRPDLEYPESHSDMQGAVRGLLQMYDIKRLPLPRRLKIQCHVCEGIRHLKPDPNTANTCPECKGKGYLNGS